MASPNEQPQIPDAANQSLSSNTAAPSTTDGNMSPRPGPAKVVSIAEPESDSAASKKPTEQDECLDLEKAAKKYRASVTGKRLSGRPSLERLGSARRSSMVGNPSLTSLLSEESDLSNSSTHHRHLHESLVKHVSTWIKHERKRRTARKAKRKAKSGETSQDTDTPEGLVGGEGEKVEGRRASESSEGSVALDHLANILERTLSLKSTDEAPRKRRISHGHKLSSIMKRHSTLSSDTDYFDGADQLVPSCEAILDNSKTMSYGGGAPESAEDGSSSAKTGRTSAREKEAWATFKYEIVRLAHTLKLKGWRRVPLEQSGEIAVERLSGALTNAVYVVSPPASVGNKEEKNEEGLPAPKNPPPKLLLRIYGPNVEHLIDREAELQILRRLARKRIGPRLLGTFSNGRFEEYFNALPLTFEELRIPDTSRQIAKRMRELHEGIDLLVSEREAGPFVWRNWDKWVDRCEQVVTWLDQQIKDSNEGRSKQASDAWRQRGLVLGVEWPFFRQTVEKYRAWLEQQYGGIQRINERLVFAHNDAQYGNILRLLPSGESPLLLPANEHKQLVVIDFEYANANVPGLEFANHFTEWCYNYHVDEGTYKCNAIYYPTPEEQHRFIRSYLLHNPGLKTPGGSASNPPTPHLGPLPSSGSTCALAATAVPTTISAFMLDSRAPPGEKYSYQDQEAQSERETEEEARRLMAETRLWRLANSAHWIAWGIVQANLPDFPDPNCTDETKVGDSTQNKEAQELDSATLEVRAEAEAEAKKNEKPESTEANNGVEDSEHSSSSGDAAEDEEFDYLGYAQERAMFFWGDAITLGIIKAEELPEGLRGKIKIVEY